MDHKSKSEDLKRMRTCEIGRKLVSLIARIRVEALYLFADIREVISNQRDALTPPMRLRGLGGRVEDFKPVGQRYLRCLLELGQLKPNEDVLDVGCGVGRVAGPLARYLNEQGSYEGFDIIPKAIKWDKQNIERRFPNFHFQLADVYNKHYNPKGKAQPSEYKFPFEKEYFDFVFLTSVFTHMLKEDMENYFTEIERVLKPKGRCLISFFVLNTYSIEMIAAKKSIFNFQYEITGYRTVDRETPEIAVAYPEKTIRELFAKNKLSIIEPIHFGWWSKGKQRSPPSTLQDIVVAIKKD